MGFIETAYEKLVAWLAEHRKSKIGLICFLAATLPLICLYSILTSPENYWGNGIVSQVFFQRMGYDKELLLRGDLPSWWNPLLYNGIPWVAGGQSSYYLPYLLLERFCSLDWTLALFIVGHRCLASVTMCMFLLSLGYRGRTCLLGGAIFSLAGPMGAYMEQGRLDDLATSAYLPAFVGMFLFALRTRGAAWTAVCGLLFAWIITSGSLPQCFVAAFTAYLLTFLLVLGGSPWEIPAPSLSCLWSKKSFARTEGSGLRWLSNVVWRERVRDAINAFTKSTIILAIGVGLTAPFLVCVFSSLNDPDIHVKFSPGATTLVPSTSAFSILTLAIGPLFDASHQTERWVPWSAGESRMAITTVGFILLCLTIFQRKNLSKTALILTIALIGYFAAVFPTSMGGVVEKLQIGALFSVVGFFGFAWLASDGAETIWEASEAGTGTVSIVGFVVAFLGLFSLLLNYTEPSHGWWEKTVNGLLQATEQTKLVDSGVLTKLLVGTYIRVSWCLMLAVGMLAAVSSPRRSARFLGIFTLTIAELFTLNYPSLAFATPDNFRLPDEARQYLATTNPDYRMVLSVNWSPLSLPYLRPMLGGNFPASPSYTHAQGLSLNALNNDSPIPIFEPSNFYRSMCARYYISSGSLVGASKEIQSRFAKLGNALVNSQPKHEIYAFEEREPWPRAFIAEHPQICTNEEAAFLRCCNPSNPVATIYRNVPDLREAALDGQEGIMSLETLPDSVKIVARVTSTRLIVLRDGYSRQWRVYVDGVASEVLSVNAGLCRGVVCTSGQHEIRFVFDPQGLAEASQIRWMVMLFLILALPALSAWSYRRRTSALEATTSGSL